MGSDLVSEYVVRVVTPEDKVGLDAEKWARIFADKFSNDEAIDEDTAEAIAGVSWLIYNSADGVPEPLQDSGVEMYFVFDDHSMLLVSINEEETTLGVFVLSEKGIAYVRGKINAHMAVIGMMNRNSAKFISSLVHGKETMQ
ncbi:hypothetical protein HC928_05025 [bacterium]|nr:hypothetical protein [bacterium]